ncbi:MAG: ABC transporter substrate-binding protein [Thermodesulfobacteriota bacterium]|nr:ABC transporter substrate-binding protein [Thermodesulfobacteriota bacterium]
MRKRPNAHRAHRFWTCLRSIVLSWPGQALVGMLAFFLIAGWNPKESMSAPIHMAVEFVDHAASAHIAKRKGWFKGEGLKVTAFDNFITGMALSAALSRGDINVAYICLIPAISAYANGKASLRVVAGTHKYGYGLLVDPKKITIISDLERSDIRIGCPREGSPPDCLLHKMIDKYHLDENRILRKIRRMPPPKVLFALKMGQLDAGFCSEQFPTMGEALGFKVLLTARDLWPDMQGSVLVVKEELISRHPEIVKKLVKVTKRGIQYIHEHPEDAATIAAGALTVAGKKVLPFKIGNIASGLEITPKVILRSLSNRMECTTDIDPGQVQKSINCMTKLGCIKWFKAEDILDLRFLHNE